MTRRAPVTDPARGPSRGPRFPRGSHLVTRDDSDDEETLATHSRVLLVEQLDSAGASLADLRPRAQVLRHAGFDVRMVAIATEGDDDLQHGTTERPLPGVERLEEPGAADRLRRAAQSMRVDALVWASTSPGGGELARALGSRWPSWWWPAGWSAEAGGGTLTAWTGDADPGDTCVLEGDRARTGRLSLWDGPYALVATPPCAADAATLFEAFARASAGRDEVDLVVLEHPDAELEAAARAADLLQRVHFVGRAPLEAEAAWFQHARTAFVALERPLSAGLVLRALAAGCPLLPVGHAAEPVARWLRRQGAAWGRAEDPPPAWEAIAAALERKPAVETAVARGRAVASRRNVESLGAACVAALRGHGADDRRAA